MHSIKGKNKQSGFLAMDAIIALTILTLITFSATFGIGIYTDMNRDMLRANNLNYILQGLQTVYASNANTIEAGPAQTITFPNPAGGNFVINDGVASANTFDGFSAYMTGLASGNIWHDGSQQGARIFISNVLNKQVNGVNLQYRNVAVVMPGNYNTAWPTNPAEGIGCPLDRNLYVCSTFDPVTGQLTYSQEDGGSVLFSTLEQQKDMLSDLEAKVKRIVKAYEDFFTINYYNDVAKSFSIDYFANGGGNWGVNAINQTVINANTAMPSTISTECVTANASTIANSGLQATLGLSTSDTVNPWGAPLCVDNASNNVRSPANASSPMQIAPFTARIVTALPGSQLYSKTVIGTY